MSTGIVEFLPPETIKRLGFRAQDMVEEPSYSTILARSSRYLAETISAFCEFGCNFDINLVDQEGFVHYWIHDDMRTVQIESAMTPASIAEAIADALADALADVINGNNEFTPFMVQVVIDQGAFLNASSGIRIADNVQQMGAFIDVFPNVSIEIVSAYD